MRGSIAAILGVGLCASAAQAEQIPGSKTDVFGWSVAAYTYGDSNKFSHCIMSASYRSGITMRFAISENYSWRIGWDHPDWKLTSGQKVELALYFDGVGPHHVTAKARDKNMAIAELPDSSALFNLFRKGYRLTVHAQGNRYDFNLDGTYAALSEVLSCAGRYVASNSPRSAPPPMAGSASPPTPRASNPAPNHLTIEQRLEATTLVANLLSQGELTGHKILTAKELKEADLQDFAAQWHVVWQADGVIGTVRIVPKTAAATAAEISTSMIAEDSRACSKGRFASGSMPDEKNARTARLFTVCQSDKSSWDVRYIIVPREEGGHYLFGTIGLPTEKGSQSGKVTATDGMLRTAVYETLKR